MLRAWAVGITTVPRARATLSRTLGSYSLTDLPTPHIFADYGALVPEGYPVTRRDAQEGGWPNFFLGLSELVMRQPEADFYLMLQDDVAFCRNVGRYIETAITNPAAHAEHRRRRAPSGEEPHAEREDYGGGVYSFYCPAGYEWAGRAASTFVAARMTPAAAAASMAVATKDPPGADRLAPPVDLVIAAQKAVPNQRTGYLAVRARRPLEIFIEGGYDIRTVQELFGHNDVRTTMVYTHVLNRGRGGVRSPADFDDFASR